LVRVGYRDHEGYYENKVQALYKGQIVELIIGLKDRIPPGLDDNGPNGNLFVEEGIYFKSTGKQSDLLLTAMADRYGIKTGPLKMKEKQVFTCANLNNSMVSYKQGVYRFKIFLETESDNAELFVNFNFDHKIIFLSDKDEAYRESLIKLLQE